MKTSYVSKIKIRFNVIIVIEIFSLLTIKHFLLQLLVILPLYIRICERFLNNFYDYNDYLL